MYAQFQLAITTPGRSLIDITHQVSECVAKTSPTIGLCNVFLHHTSASLIICENADPLVQADLENFMYKLVPDGDPMYKHVDEGPDDMPSHVRSILTTSFLSLPITDGKIALGRWQGIYLWEHRIRSHNRKLTVTIAGE